MEDDRRQDSQTETTSDGQEKYQVWVEVVGKQGSHREIAERWNIDRATVVKIVQLAKQGALDQFASSLPGRRGKSREMREIADAKAEVTRLTETVKEQAVELMLLRGKGRGIDRSRPDAR